MRSAFLTIVLCFLTTCIVRASDEQIDFFEKKIRPVLVDHCYECHAVDAKKIRGGLLLDSRDAMRKGGESGSGVVPNEPDESLVLDALRHESFEMPPSGKLSDEVIADFEKWIRNGAHDPREATATIEAPATIDIEEGKKFWSFRPLVETDPPSVEDTTWPESDIDLYLQSRLEKEGIEHAEDADRTTLARRVYYALIGMPPTPEQITQFENDAAPAPEAMAKLVDRLLESKHFGERWGRHWLDVVRFAESSGGGRTLLFKEAWRYRDYVIEAFNDDLPYDHFLREQIAGDLIPTDDWQTKRRQLTASTFLLLGPTNYELQDKDVLEMDIVDEQIDTIGKAFMGMTIGCARCHDHKFDPIPMRDYYAMAGIFKSTKSVIHSNVSAWNKMKLPVAPVWEMELSAHEELVAKVEEQLKQAKSRLKKIESKQIVEATSLVGIVVDNVDAKIVGPWTGSTSVKSFVGAGYIHDNNKRDEDYSVTFTTELPTGKYELRVAYSPGSNRSTRVPVNVHHADGITTRHINQKKKPKLTPFVSLGRFKFDSTAKVTISNEDAAPGHVIADAVQFIPENTSSTRKRVDPPTSTDAVENPQLTKLKSHIKQLEALVSKLKSDGPKRELAMAPTEEKQTADVHLAIRGVVANRGPIVPRGVLQVALNRDFPEIHKGESGRLQLADWVVDRTNPLTARVMVNRVWYWLFGEGLVRTVDNFGSMGEEPSHPELLDHLAVSFMEEGWSVKRLIRRIMLSRTYRLSSHANTDATDRGNRLLWRMNRTRLDAESIRDSMMHIAGSLELTIGGANIKEGTKIEYDYVFDSSRRSVYLPVFRNTLPEIFAAFDFADPNIQGGKRTTSTIAPQALLLMNQPFVIKQTKQAATRLLSEDTKELDARIEHCYQQVLGRLPSNNERQLAVRFVAEDRDGDRWSLLYQTLFQSLDFRYVK